MISKNDGRQIWRGRGPGSAKRPLMICGCLGLACLSCVASELAGPPEKPADLFQCTKVWTVHLQFTPAQWEALEPKGAQDAFPGPGGRPRGGPGGPGGFGPAMFLAPSFLKGDQDKDGKLSKEEFRSLGERWFSDWDKEKRGTLKLDELQAGVRSTLIPEVGEGGPGDPGNRTPGPPLQGANGRNGLAAAAGIDFKYVHADLDFDGHLLRDVAVRYKGNGTYMESRNSIKKSFKIDLNKYVKGQKVAGVTKLNLHNNVTDASWMNEVLSHRLFRDAGVPAPRTAYARVFVTVPGQFDKKYFGLYSIVEDIDSHYAQERFGSKDGAIFKPVTHDLFAYRGEDWSKYTQTYDPKTELSNREKRRVMDFANLVTSASDSDFSNRIAEYLDLDEFARFMSVTVWLSTMDSILMMGQNFYVYLHPQTHKFEFLPWDLDHSFGQFPMGSSQEDREELSIQKPWRGTNRFLERIFKTEAFKKLYLAFMADFSKSIFAPERFYQQVDEVAAAIRPSVREESDVKFARFEKVVAGESVERLRFGGEPGGVPPGVGGAQDRPRFGHGGYLQPAKPIKGFVTARALSVKDQLEGKSEGAIASDSSFGPRGFRGGPGGPNGFGPGMFLARAFMDEFDTDKDGKITHGEFISGFSKWFEEWNTDKSGALTEEQLRSGINRDLSPFHGGLPGGPQFGPPDGPPSER